RRPYGFLLRWRDVLERALKVYNGAGRAHIALREMAMVEQSHPVDQPVRIVFMGTPDFAVPTLQALVENAQVRDVWPAGLELVGVVTRPDKPVGRGLQTVYSPVKQYAMQVGLPVLQMRSLRWPDTQETLRELEPDLIIVA